MYEDETIRENFAHNVQLALNVLEEKQAWLAEKVGINKMRMSRIMNASATLRVTDAKNISRALGVPLDTLLDCKVSDEEQLRFLRKKEL